MRNENEILVTVPITVYVPAVPLWLDIAASIAAFLGAVWFTRWYPVVVRRAVGAAGPNI